MHELAVCQGLIEAVERVAHAQRATAVHAVTVAVGTLSGVEPGLLARAFEVARAGTVAALAQLHVDALPARVACAKCGAHGDVPPNRLLCPACGDWQVRVIGGEQLMLTRVELTRATETPTATVALG